MYKIIVRGEELFKCPSESIVPLALSKAIDNCIIRGNIHNEETAVEYLATIGIIAIKES